MSKTTRDEVATLDASRASVNIRRFQQATAYEAPNHFGMHALRLQGMEAGGPESLWVGLSHILPGGHAGPDASPIEKVYVILYGKLALVVDGQETVLGPHDSCCISPNVSREIINRTNDMAAMLVIIPRAGA